MFVLGMAGKNPASQPGVGRGTGCICKFIAQKLETVKMNNKEKTIFKSSCLGDLFPRRKRPQSMGFKHF